ncbi:hypothetical protein J2Z22_003619 [Paenibacillus forsythiae]|uniref:SLH domain-containing protein n=1 Tax=Paenibacillus forsythiae TaxID=365616 RepID=A0ABU3HB42_9BACL|nr:S-layer homology domain-containing protein [Paenibacillus forsythiae]MDT3428029.1 hypothetical protein [Paenibacillus forsythiae]
MQRIKRPFLWLVMAALFVSLLPVGLTQHVSAATTSTYFIPDDQKLLQTKGLNPEATGTDPAKITRSSVYITNNGNMTITGTYSLVTGSTIKVKVEQLTQDSTSGRWVTDAGHVTIGSVTLDSANSANRFTTSGLTLYTGYNKVTFTGVQGGLERSESFYVLYDKVPFIQSLQVLGGGPEAIDLNEGTQVVVPNNQITIRGKVANATSVTLSLNGGDMMTTSLLEDGTFFTSSLSLVSGINSLKFVVKTASDSITIDRSLYYFDTTQPFTDMELSYDSQYIKALNTTPVLTGTAQTGVIAQILLPYNAATNPFSKSDGTAGTDTTVKIGTNTVPIRVLKLDRTPGASSDEIIIPGPDGETPAYRLVKFKVDGVSLASGTNNFKLFVTYGNFSTSYTVNYKYMPGETVITDLYYLPGYNGTSSVTNVSKLALDGAEVDKATFYIMVRANKNLAATNKLVASYLPLSTKNLSLTLVTPTASPSGLGSNEQIYKVSDFSNGQQKVRFKFEGSEAYKNVDISYVSKNYIYVSNLQDGQTYSFNSKIVNTMTIEGQYIGFENITNAQFYVNGVAGNGMTQGPESSKDGPDTTLGVDATHTAFSLALNIKAEGPLVYGENKIVFTGTSMDGAGNLREVRKELRIYIVDTNVSTLSVFRPATGTGRTSFNNKPLASLTSTELSDILRVSPEFVNRDGKYVTSEQSYDLLIRGGGASILNLFRGSEQIFSSKGITDLLTSDDRYKTAGTYTYTTNGVSYSFVYDYAGSEKDFILRIRDLKFDAPGSQVFNLELINSTGARSTQRLEVERVVSPYLILSPVPTVGDQIVVNKNFVRFDIEAEGATKVMIDKYEATKRTDLPNRFVYDYVGLKPDKATVIKIQIVRADSTLNDTVTVYYTSAVQIDTQYMAEKAAVKYSVFNKELELNFPKGTVMKGYSSSGAAKYYPDQKLLFGIADPRDGVVERRNDYGNIINLNKDARTEKGESTIIVPADLTLRFGSTVETTNFSRVSDIYWISGGLGESGIKQAVNGIAPYSIEGNFTQFGYDRKIVPSQRGELTLAFNDSVVDEVGTNITVFRYTDSGIWENIGGEVNTKAHTVTVPFDEFGYYTVMKLRRGYSDITNHPWARNILNGLYSKGIMTYLRADQFGADDLTTRGEFATLLVKGLNIPLNYDVNQQTFFDIVPEAKSRTWDFKYIETAARAGIVTGLSDGFFGPDIPLTREQAAVMIARALKLKLSANNDKLLTGLGKSFVDAGSSDYYSRPAIEAVSKAKIMEGSPITMAGSRKPVYNFNPKGKLTRAEAGKIVVALLQKSTSIFPKSFS